MPPLHSRPNKHTNLLPGFKTLLVLFIAALLIQGCNLRKPSGPPTAENQIHPSPPIAEASSTAVSAPIPTSGEETLPNGEGIIPNGQMALVPAGPFWMGCDPDHNDGNDCPRHTYDDPALHQVYLDAYQIDIYEVTNANYLACIGLGGCTPPTEMSSPTRPDYFFNLDYGNYPVLNLSWEQAAAYCAWIGKRLPTEAEWIKAGRGSADTRPYPWGETSPDCSLANTSRCLGDTAPTGSSPAGASPYGVLDLVGNAREWVANWWRTEYNPFAPDHNPLGPAGGTYQMFMGSDWNKTHDHQLVIRTDPNPSFVNALGQVYIGFRCAAAADYPQGVSFSLDTAPAITPLPPVAQPAAGKATLAGRVLWNNQPVAGLEANTCAGYTSINGCPGEVLTTTTDLEGWYIFEDLLPETYGVSVHALDPELDKWFYFYEKPAPGMVAVNPKPTSFTLPAGQILILEDMLVFGTDLQVTAPLDGAYLDEPPKLTWDAYPGAAYYGVSINQGYQSSAAEKVTGNEFPITRELKNCRYNWEVTAYDGQGLKLAELPRHPLRFNLVGQRSSCWLEVISPPNGATLRAGEPIDFSWRPDPLAVRYNVFIHNEDYELVTESIDLSEPFFSLLDGLPPGQYQWSADAFDHQHDMISSGFLNLTVLPAGQPFPPQIPTPDLSQPVPMVLIPAGEFQMGAEDLEDAKPVHRVSLDAFMIDVYEVTNARYAQCVSAGWCLPSSRSFDPELALPSFASLPVVEVTWYDAQAYCAWRGGRLPSEAEWEKAARGGLEGKLYPWGDEPPVCTPGAVNGAQTTGCEPYGVIPVGSFAPNGYGLYDTTGNASEWVADWYQDDYYASSPAGNPPGAESGVIRVSRGGSYSTSPWAVYLNVAFRGSFFPSLPSEPSGDTGFRCAAEP